MFSNIFSSFLALTVSLLNLYLSSKDDSFYFMVEGYFRDYLWRAIWFISEQDNIYVSITVVKGLWDPELFDVFEWTGICDIIDHDDSISPFVVGRGDGSKSFLSGSIPDLELNIFVIVFESFEPWFRRRLPEIYADGGQIVFGKFVVGELGKDGSFADAWAPD